MKKAINHGSTSFLKIVIAGVACVILVLCIFVLPVGLSTDTAGYGPIIIGMYVSAIPFFIALYQAIRLLGYIERAKAFSEQSVCALQRIKYCAISISALYTVGSPYIYYVADKDDAPGVVAIGCVIVGASLVIAVATAVFEQLVQAAVDIKSENDLTV